MINSYTAEFFKLLPDYFKEEQVDDEDDLYTIYASIGRWLRDNAFKPAISSNVQRVVKVLNKLALTDNNIAIDLINMGVFEYLAENIQSFRVVSDMANESLLRYATKFLIDMRLNVVVR